MSSKASLVIRQKTTPKGVRILLPKSQSSSSLNNRSSGSRSILTTPPLQSVSHQRRNEENLPLLDVSTSDESVGSPTIQNGSFTNNTATLREITNLREEMEKRIENESTKHKEKIESLQEELSMVREELSSVKEHPVRKQAMKIPPGISSMVCELYKPFLLEGGWNFRERFTSYHNFNINGDILNALRDQNLGVNMAVLRKAVNRYFESLKRAFKENQLSPTSRHKKRSHRLSITRRHRLFQVRASLEKSEEDENLWNTLNVWAMSDDETDDEGHWKMRTLPWRCDDATDLCRRCDEALEVVRVYGEPSERKPNGKCGNFLKEGLKLKLTKVKTVNNVNNV